MFFVAGNIAWGQVVANQSVATRVKDIARLQGVRNNQLNGMGLVIGLNGTGDSSKVNAQMVANVLAKWGIDVNVADLKVKNIAAVMITATLPPYLHQGDTLDIQVASFGDAKSLQGGILLQAPLSGADGNVYAVAQGSVHVGGYAAGEKGASVQKNVTTVGTVLSGAIVEREVPMQFQYNSKLNWSLHSPDFTTATRLAQSINRNIADDSARAVDMGLVEVKIPQDRMNDPISFIAEIEALPVTPDGLAKVVVNERTGTIVIGDKVRLAPVAVTHRNVTVKISAEPQVSQPAPLSDGETTVTEKTKVEVYEETGRIIMMPAGTSIGTIVRALNKVGTTPQDIIAILTAIKNAGALYGVLEFM
ncbi:MAG TPA: flagellar basal body P-ring protein FlgI [Bacillota bacterium]|nr:flagellar basal body P-ring protein FlgI [Bacillota bacterium]